MILIADSGSTKTDWRIISPNQVKADSLKTNGINPHFRTEEDIFTELHPVFNYQYKTNINRIFFYGAGCSDASRNAVVKNVLEKIFNKPEIEVYSDTFGAARSLCKDKPGIIATLGTGSNSCLYDGKKIIDGIPPLGYILGDEASGTFFGKKLLNDYFKRMMPKDIAQLFKVEINTELSIVQERVYRQPLANQYLAEVSKFLFNKTNHPYVYSMVRNGISEFFVKNIFRYENCYNYNVSFTGSIAYYFKKILKIVANEQGFKIGKIVQSPIDGLEEFHRENLL